MKKINISIRVMSTVVELILNYDSYDYSIQTNNGGILMSGYYSRGSLISNYTTRTIELFQGDLEKLATKEIKKDKEIWKQILNK